MNKTTHHLIYSGLLIFLSSVIFVDAQEKKIDESKLTGPYLGRKSPGMIPEIFAPGIISRGDHEHRCAVSPDGNEIYYSASAAPDSRMQIMSTRRINQVWIPPAIASFSDKGMNLHPAFAPDGKRLYFVSTRPSPAKDGPKKGADIWFVERQGELWSEPVNIGEAVNTEANESSPSVAADGTLFFDRIVKANKGETGIYFSRFENGAYQKAEKLPFPVNTEYEDLGPFITPDGRCLLFNSDRPGTFGEADLYVAHKNTDGGWQEPVNLGETINSKQYDWAPMITPDGIFLIFSSYRNSEPIVPNSGQGTFFWVEVKVITDLKPKIYDKTE